MAAFCSTSRIVVPCRLTVADRLEDLLDQHGRQSHGRLVEQEQPGLGHEGAADGQHLLLTARERAGHLGDAAPASRGNSVNTRSMSSAHAAVAAEEGAHHEVLAARSGD